jgi:hypothetical protein
MLKRNMFEDTYLGHDRLSIFALDITERHLRALVLVDPQLWMVDVRDLVDGYCALSASYTSSHLDNFDVPLSCTQILVTRTAVSVVICTGPRRLPW